MVQDDLLARNDLQFPAEIINIKSAILHAQQHVYNDFDKVANIIKSK